MSITKIVFSVMEPFEKPLFNGRIFNNPSSFSQWKGLPGFRSLLRWKFTEKDDSALPAPAVLAKSLPIRTPEFNLISKLSATWLGHATVFVHMEEISFITDPVWAQRASPFSCAGPLRYRPPPCEIDALPTVSVMITVSLLVFSYILESSVTITTIIWILKL